VAGKTCLSRISTTAASRKATASPLVSNAVGQSSSREAITEHRSALDDYPPDAETEGMGSHYAQKILHFYC
jgi:hypothetical protein